MISKKIKLVDIFNDNPIRLAAISVPNARCVYIENSIDDNDIYEIREDFLIGPLDSISFHEANGIFAIYSKTDEGYKEVGMFYPSQQKVDDLPTWIKTDILMKDLTKKINSYYGTLR